MSLNAFLSDNVEKLESRKVIISNRFKDEDGKPIEWIFRPLTANEDDIIRSESFKEIQDKKTGRISMKTDSIGYIRKMTASSVEYPDLYNAKLQDSYGVSTPEQLLTKMLYSGEYLKAQKTAQEVNKINEIDELVEEAKNE